MLLQNIQPKRKPATTRLDGTNEWRSMEYDHGYSQVGMGQELQRERVSYILGKGDDCLWVA